MFSLVQETDLINSRVVLVNFLQVADEQKICARKTSIVSIFLCYFTKKARGRSRGSIWLSPTGIDTGALAAWNCITYRLTSFDTSKFCQTFPPILRNPLFHHIQILLQTSDD